MNDYVDLVEQARAGDDAAYGELVARFQDMAYGYAYAILRDFSLAQDAAQEAFVEAYRCLPTLSVPRAFPSWLKRIVFKHCDRLTRGSRLGTAPLEAAQHLAAPVAGPEEEAERRDLRSQVVAAVAALPDDQRTVTTLYYINGYSQHEIAAFLDVPDSTVKSRLHTSRRRLREEMLAMVKDALQSNALPESFAEETLARTIEEAAALNKAHVFGEAEGLLRDVLGKTPPGATGVQAAALKELNRTLMWGQYEDGRFDERWNELVENGRAILAAGSDDEVVWRELARTLMYIPRMREAVSHLEAWITRKGPRLERLGMLAWARGCIADYDGAEAAWREQLELAAIDSDDAAVVDIVSYTCLTLVDCFASADFPDRAARVAEAGWLACRDRGDILFKDGWRSDADWLHMAHLAGLDYEARARYLLEKWMAREGSQAAGMVLVLRAWLESPESLLPAWRAWVRERIGDGEWNLMSTVGVGGLVHPAYRITLRPAEGAAIAEATWEVLNQPEVAAPDPVKQAWQFARFDVFAYLLAGDLAGAARVAQQATEAFGLSYGGDLQIVAAAALGAPTPPDLVQAVEEQGIGAVDAYGMAGWYLIAREAAAVGDKARALEALRRTLSYWTNPPLGYLARWENDARWGRLADDPDVRALFAEKRASIGPIQGRLWYFPGW